MEVVVVVRMWVQMVEAGPVCNGRLPAAGEVGLGYNYSIVAAQ